MDKKISIAIDGPAAAGKSTVAKIVAEKLGYIYIDTGAMYRALTYKAISQHISLDADQALLDLLLASKIELLPGETGQQVLLDGTNVTREIRTTEVSNHVSVVSAHQTVRKEMVQRQQELAVNSGVVMDGRDIGTHVLPNAEVKIFLIASVEERAKRRYTENVQKGITTDLVKLKQEIEQRDRIDTEREVAPLIKANDAIEIDTTSLSINDVAQLILQEVSKFRNR